MDEKFETWKKLTSLITKETLNRIYPLCQRISPSTQVDCTAELEKKERKKLGITDTDDGVFANVRVRFTKIPEQKFPDGANPQEITKYSIDNSYALERMFQEIGKPNGETIFQLNSMLSFKKYYELGGARIAQWQGAYPLAVV